MLYLLHYVEHHKVHELNWHFLYFIEKIRNVNRRAIFDTQELFHVDFLPKIQHGNSKTMREKFQSFFDSFKVISDVNKSLLYDLIQRSQNAEIFFESDESCSEFKSDNIRILLGDDTLKDLMIYLYSYLTGNTWDIDKHYRIIYDHIPYHKACPFCGIGDLPNRYRPDYDHLAYKSTYPLMAINLRNIAPGCNDCNQKFKKTKDVFYANGDLIRTQFLYPYVATIDINLDFSKSIYPQTDLNNQSGKWTVDILPDNNLTQTWNIIYDIKERYIDECIAVKYKTWVYQYFIDEIKDKNIENLEQLKIELDAYSLKLKNRSLDDKSFVWTYFFKYLATSNNKLIYNSILREYQKVKTI